MTEFADPPPSWRDARESIRQTIGAGALDAALDRLEPWLSGKAGALPETERDEAFALLKRALQADGGDAARSPAAGMLRWGRMLIDMGRQEMAAGVLKYAVEAFPKNARVLAELVAALELGGRHREAVSWLERFPSLVRSDSLLTYLHAFNAILTGDFQTAQGMLPRLQSDADEKIRFMAGRIERMLGRADVVRPLSGLPLSDRRGWHFVLTGGVLLDVCEDPAKGDCYRNVGRGIDNLRLVLDAWHVSLPGVLFPPERNSEILARVIAGKMGCAAKKWMGEAEAGLLVVYDPVYLIPEFWEAAKGKAKGQILFVHMMNEAKEDPVAPDILASFYLRNAPPWGPGFDADDEYIDPVEGSPEEAVAIVAQKIPDAPQYLPGLGRFAQAIKDIPSALRPSALQEEGERERLWVRSPAYPAGMFSGTGHDMKGPAA